MIRAPGELDRGSYLSHYGVLNLWTLWLLAHEPELVGLTPSELRAPSEKPKCPSCGCLMQMRAYAWRCYYHAEPVTLKPGIQAPEVKWAPHQPSALSCVGKDVDVEWDPERGGYVIVPVPVNRLRLRQKKRNR